MKIGIKNGYKNVTGWKRYPCSTMMLCRSNGLQLNAKKGVEKIANNRNPVSTNKFQTNIKCV
jgi:hypothetical protein